jgi:hypothetical protein
LKAQADINSILGKDHYTPADKTKIIQLLDTLGLKKSDESKFAILRQNRGHLVKRPKNGPIQIVADGRDDWVGWVELTLEQVNEKATQNTARVIKVINADVLGVVEAESRPALVRFCKDVMPAVNGTGYDHIMLIDGNDDRGIDVGLMTKRKRQAARVATIYRQLRQKHDFIAVIGDLNDTPDSDPISPLFSQTGLKDISELPGFDDGGRPGTFKNSTASNKLDYILLSPALFAKATAGGIFRLGVWGGTNGTLFPHFPEITREVEAASDHAAIFAVLDI